MASGSMTTGDYDIDPLLHRYGRIDASLPIDPALFELEGLVNDVRRGKVKLDEHAEEDHEVVEEHDIDPALREIVNSLTNAQQSSAGQTLSSVQNAALGHLADNEDGQRLQQSIEEITSGNYGLLLPNAYPTSPGPFTLAHPEPTDTAMAGPSEPTASLQADGVDRPPVRQGRGRPKGSKNKPKLNPKPKPPKPPKPPSKPRGRPPKVRTPEEQAVFEAKKADRALGIKRRKGRPRKFPGYLVREMRLRKNRAEYLELCRRYREGLPIEGLPLGDGDGEDGEEEAMNEHGAGKHLAQIEAGMDGDHGDMEVDGAEGVQGVEGGDIVYPWPTDDQALLDVVGSAASIGVDGDVGDEVDHTEDSIRQVFGL